MYSGAGPVLPVEREFLVQSLDRGRSHQDLLEPDETDRINSIDVDHRHPPQICSDAQERSGPTSGVTGRTANQLTQESHYHPVSSGNTLSYLMALRGSAIISATVSRQAW